jgi:alkylation response protein AidB-like acyl-CoA dehydrogenase
MNDTALINPPVQARPGSADLRRRYAAIAADSAKRDADRIHPHEALALLKKVRFGALSLPVEQGGGGGTLRDVIAEAILLAEADPNVAHIFRNHFMFVERFLGTGPADKHPEWRRIVLNGGIVGLATTELNRPVTGGSIPQQTALTPDGDGWRLRGTKFYSTGSLYADLILIKATAPGDIGVTVVVPTDRAGVERVDDWDGIGQRVTGTGTTNLHDVRVEAHEVDIDRDNQPGLLHFISAIAQLFVTAVVAGTARASLRDAKALLLSRGRNFYFAPSAVASQDPILQETIGHLSANAFAAEHVVLAAADALVAAARARRDGGPFEELVHEASLAAAKAKIVADELALRSATALFDVGGASAATQRQNLDRHWRNARTLTTHNPASYKAQAVGAWEVVGTKLPGLGFF